MIFVRMYQLFFNMCGGTGTKAHPKKAKNDGEEESTENRRCALAEVRKAVREE